WRAAMRLASATVNSRPDLNSDTSEFRLWKPRNEAINRNGGRMPGAGTDHTKPWIATAGPVLILVEPQLGENIGAAARAMANFGLSQLRMVKPREPWPNLRARMMAAGADAILDGARVFDTVAAAIADLNFVF